MLTYHNLSSWIFKLPFFLEFVNLCTVPVFGCGFPKLVRFGRFTRSDNHSSPPHPNQPPMLDGWRVLSAICYGSCPYRLIWIGKPIANFKATQTNTFWDVCPFDGFCGRFDLVWGRFATISARQINKKMVISGVWFHTKRPEICSNC